jgi:tetratricopeptide (TPR) repeat protein
MGDNHHDPLRVDFDRQIKLEFHGSTVTSDAGLLAYRELDDALGLTSAAASTLHDTRTGQNTQHSLTALLRQSIYSRLAGYEDVNDAERLCLDPAMRTIVGGRAKDNTAASTSEMARFESETLSTKENLNQNRQGKYKEAEEGYRKALAIYRKVLGEEHPDTATSYNNLAANQDDQGKHREAEEGYRKALATVQCFDIETERGTQDGLMRAEAEECFLAWLEVPVIVPKTWRWMRPFTGENRHI